MSDFDAEPKAGRILTDEVQVTWWQRLYQWVLNHFWYLRPCITLTLTITPSHIFKMLETAAKPSTKRLHLRNLFAHGRRYFIQARSSGGFHMVTTNKVPWHPRRRTSAAAILTGSFEAIDEQLTRMTLQGRIKTFYLLDALALPAFAASMVIFMAWPLWAITLLIMLLFGLSWAAHHYNAKLEVHEMLFFIETVLEDFAPDPQPALMSKGPDLVYDPQMDFAEAWEKFYNSITEDLV